MSTVSILATVFVVVGWGIIILVALLIFSGSLLSGQVFRSPQAAQLVIGALTPFFFLSLGPFLGWGILQALVEIHRELEGIREALKSNVRPQVNPTETGVQTGGEPLS